MHRLTPGKARGLARISDGEGRFGVLAIDQRPPLFQLAARALGKREDQVDAEVAAIKAMLARTLVGEITGLLVDPVYGYRSVAPLLPPRVGLLLTLEDHRFTVDANGWRRSALIPGWSVEAAVRAGAEALKLLVWDRPEAPAEVRADQHRLVAAVGEACARADRPFVLELLPYPLPDEDAATYRRRLPEISAASAAAYADPALAVDLYKLALPAAAEDVREWGGDAYALADLQRAMAEMTSVLPAPWVLLSGGMSGTQFEQALRAALAAGARGYLAGRAVWLAPLRSYPDVAAVASALRDEGTATLRRLNGSLRELPAWEPAVDWGAGIPDGRS